MKNQLGVGKSVDVVVPSGGFTAGVGYVLGKMFGVAATTELVGATAALHLEGVFRLNKLSAQAWVVGDLIYWDDTLKQCTNSWITPQLLIGVAVAVAANPSPTGDVRLNGSYRLGTSA